MGSNPTFGSVSNSIARSPAGRTLFWQRFCHWALLTLIAFTALALLIESSGNPQSLRSLVGLSSATLIAPTAILAALYSYFYGPWLGRFWQKVLLLLWLLSGLLIGGLIFYEYQSDNPNFTYSLLRLHPSRLLLDHLFLTLLLLANNLRKLWARPLWLITWLPVAAFTYLLLTSWLHFDFFAEITKEDNLIENLQVLLLLVSASGCWWLSSRPSLRGKNWLRMLSIILGLAFLAVAGDEISWGERLLRLDGESVSRNLNRQGETTFHNLYAVDWALFNLYRFLSFLGLLGGVVKLGLERLGRRRLGRLLTTWLGRSCSFTFSYPLFIIFS